MDGCRFLKLHEQTLATKDGVSITIQQINTLIARIDHIDIAAAVLTKAGNLAYQLKEMSHCKDTTLSELDLCLRATKFQLKVGESRIQELGTGI
jgi:hypothetical protein